ncbi:MAG: NAD(P)/FAD-dependent oxidoreductase, partial [Pseudomonadota bacterium]
VRWAAVLANSGMAWTALAAEHTARWDDTVSWAGKRVGVVGSAASAVQAIPELAKTAAHLTVFQRTPNWMIPRNDQPVTDELKALMMSNLEAAAKIQDLNRNLIFENADGLTWHAFSFTDEGRAALTRQALDHLHDQVSDPELRAKLTPDYPVGCKRILICDDFYPTLQLPHVSLETDPIARVTPEGVEMKSGAHHAFDILVFATGFNTSDWRWSVDVQGPNETLNEAWAGGAEAHRGVTVAGFPNFFVLYGPNTNLGHNSITYMLEAQVGYVIDALDRMETGGLVTLQPRADIQSRYNEALQKELAETVWGDPACGQSWYKAADGKITQNWSRPAREFKEMLYELRLEEFETA